MEPARRREVWLLALLLLFSLGVRMYTMRYIAAGGDAFKYVLAAKKLAYSVPAEHWEWSHHASRFSVIVPAAVVERLFLGAPGSYYVLPVAYSVALTSLAFAVGRRAAGLRVGVAAAIGVVVFPLMQRNGSQIAPGIFSATYLMIATYGLVRYADAGEDRGARRWLLLVIAGAALAWFSKVANVLAFPGLALGVWVLRRRWSDAALLCAALAIVIGAEWLAYASWTDYGGGRLGVISEQHLDHPRLKPLGSQLALLTRWFKVEGYWYPVLFPALAAWGYLFVKRREQARLLALTIAGLTFWLGLVFAVKDVDPLTPAVPPRSRYLFPAMPVALLAVLGVVDRFVPRGTRVERALLRPAPLAATLLLLAVVFARSGRRQGDLHPLREVNRLAEVARDGETRGLPVVGLGKRIGLEKKLHGYLAIYWQGWREGVDPPAHGFLEWENQEVYYLVFEGSGLTRRRMRRMLKRGEPMFRTKRDRRRDGLSRFAHDYFTLAIESVPPKDPE